MLLDVEGHLLARGAGVGALRAGVAAPRVLPHDAAGGGVPCKDARGGKQGARPPAHPPARSAPPPRLAGATQSHGAGCGVCGPGCRLHGAGCCGARTGWCCGGRRPPAASPTCTEGPSPREEPPGRERGCAPPAPASLGLSPLRTPRSKGQRFPAWPRGWGDWGHRSPRSCFSCCFCPRAPDEPGWVVLGVGVQPATPLLSKPTWVTPPLHVAPKAEGAHPTLCSPGSIAAPCGASPSPCGPLPATHRPPHR